MSYYNCRHGDPCEDCNGYIGPLDTRACLCDCHTRAECNGMCLMASEVLGPGYAGLVAHAHPECEQHAKPAGAAP